jgi:hypothetical protein
MQYEYGTPEAKAFMDGGNDAGHSISPIVNSVFALDHEMAGGREKAAHSMERGV